MCCLCAVLLNHRDHRERKIRHEFLWNLRKRDAVRAYEDKPVARNTYRQCTGSRTAAPPSHPAPAATVVQSPEGLEKWQRACTTPTPIPPRRSSVCSDTSDCWVRNFDRHCIHEIGASIVTTYMMLAATEQGLGSLWVERFEVRRSCGKNSSCRKNYVPDSALSGLPQAGGSQGANPATTPGASR